MGGGAAYLTVVQKSVRVGQPQAAEPSDLGTDLVAAALDESDDEDEDEDESEEELPDSLEEATAPELSAPLRELLRGPLPALRRSSRESLR